MKTIKLSIIINTFFIFFTLLFSFYAIFFYNDNGFLASILLSALIAVIFSLGYVITAIKRGDFIESKYDAENLLNSFNYFLFLKTKSEILKLLEDYFLQKKVKTTILENSILITKSNTEIFPIIKPEIITLSEIIEIRKSVKQSNKVIILAVDFSSEATQIIKKLNLDITLLKTSELYKSLSELNILPEIKIYNEPKTKLNLENFFKKLFAKNNAKKFLITGILLTIMSFFTFYPIFYLIIGTSLMLTSVVLRLKKDVKPPTKNALDNIVEK